jgi:uncharacterized protein
MKNLYYIFSVILFFLTSSIVWSANFQKGLDAYKNGNFTNALREWRPLAEQGNDDAQFILGLMYKNGEGVPQSNKTAVKWFTLSSDQGNVNAQFALGVLYQSGLGVKIDYNKSYELNFKAAMQGHNKAKYNAANLIIGEQIDERDMKIALKFLEEARVSGQIDRGMAENSIGWIYLTGVGGIKTNYKKSLYWGIEGGKKGATNAYSNVALQYFAGLGVAQNYNMMVGYLIKSLENFKNEDDWILREEDEWVKFKKKAPINFWEPRQIYWKYILHRDKKYILELKKLIE